MPQPNDRLYATLELLDTRTFANAHRNLTPLKIEDKGVRFFQEALLDNSEFLTDGTHWYIRFFKRQQPIDVRINFHASADAPTNAKLGFACMVISEDKTLNDDAVAQVSQFIRSSNSLAHHADRFIRLGDGHLITDRNALGAILPSYAYPRWQRTLLLLALALAYGEQMQRFTDRVYEAIKRGDLTTLRTLHEEMLVFNAACYFRFPVRQQNHELNAVWNRLHDHFQLGARNDELSQQIASVGEMAHNRLEAQRSKRYQRLEVAFWVVGAVLAGLSLF